VVECSRYRYLYDGLMLEESGDRVNRCAPASLEEEGKTHWPVQETADASWCLVEAAESEFQQAKSQRLYLWDDAVDL
jgi:hypothetical protein